MQLRSDTAESEQRRDLDRGAASDRRDGFLAVAVAVLALIVMVAMFAAARALG